MSTRKPVRKAVFPVAGLGTRFLPATKAIPKEMLPIVDRPLIQYAVDEAREAGIEQMIFVTGRGKTAMVEHFDMAFELEATMAERGKAARRSSRRRSIPGDLITFASRCRWAWATRSGARARIVGDEPFAILLPDELMIGRPAVWPKWWRPTTRWAATSSAVLEVPWERGLSYGVITPGVRDGALTEVTGLVEKPRREEAPSNLIVSVATSSSPKSCARWRARRKARAERSS